MRHTSATVRTRRILESLTLIGLALVALVTTLRHFVDWSWWPFVNGCGTGLFLTGLLTVVLPRRPQAPSDPTDWEVPDPPSYDERDRHLRLQALSTAALVLAAALVAALALEPSLSEGAGVWVGGSLLLGLATYLTTLLFLDRRGASFRS